jgi:hypothetical protein
MYDRYIDKEVATVLRNGDVASSFANVARYAEVLALTASQAIDKVGSKSAYTVA